MSQFESDDEQVQAIKEWWQKNGTSILSTLLIASLAWAGWSYYQNQKMAKAIEGSITFEVLQVNLVQGTFGNVAREGLKLMEAQPESPYAAGSAFLLAKFYFSKGKTDEAVEQLKWVNTHTPDDSLKLVAALRLAKIYLNDEKLSEAEKVLTSARQLSIGKAETANLDYELANYFLAKKDRKQAAEYLKKVVSNPEAETNLSHLAQLQLDDLA